MPIGTKKVLIAAEVSRSLKASLLSDSRFEVEYSPKVTEEALAAAVGECEVLVTRHYNGVTGRVIDAAPRLRLIAQGTSGIDNIDTARAAERGIAVADAAGENANAVAELVIANAIALSRSIPTYQQMMREGDWVRADCDTRHELRWYRLGVVGIGRVGRRVSALAAAFGVEVLAYDPYVDASEIGARGAKKIDSLSELLETCTMLSLHVPLTSETRAMIGPSELDRLRPEAIVINASRGEVLDLAAVIARVQSGRLAGAAIDVFEPEPPPAIAATGDPRLIFTPHIAGCSFESKDSIGSVIYEKICRFFELEPLRR